jgi:hypothetical protein
MKATVIKSFVDKDTKKLQFVGSAVEYSDERYKVLADKGYLKAIEETPGKTDTKKPGGGVQTSAQLT